MANKWKQWQTIILGSKITADGDCSHEIKRCLLLGRKGITNLDTILRSGDIILLTKVCLVKAIVFPVVKYECESWTIKQAEHWKLMVWTVVLEKPLESSLDFKETQPVNPKENQSWIFTERTDAEAEAPILYSWYKEPIYYKRPWCWERLKAGGEGDDGGWDG